MSRPTAVAPSRCPCCDGPIEEGDTIALLEGEWVHEACAEEDGGPAE